MELMGIVKTMPGGRRSKESPRAFVLLVRHESKTGRYNSAWPSAATRNARRQGDGYEEI